MPHPFRTQVLWKQRAGLGRSRLRLHLVVQVTISAKPEGQAGNGDIDKADRHRPWAQETKSDGKSSLSHNTHKGGVYGSLCFIIHFVRSPGSKNRMKLLSARSSWRDSRAVRTSSLSVWPALCVHLSNAWTGILPHATCHRKLSVSTAELIQEPASFETIHKSLATLQSFPSSNLSVHWENEVSHSNVVLYCQPLHSTKWRS